MADNTGEWGRKAARDRVGSVSGGGSDNSKSEKVFAQPPQFEEDAHGAGYDNDVPRGDWVDKSGTAMPNFDKRNAWRGGKLREAGQGGGVAPEGQKPAGE